MPKNKQKKLKFLLKFCAGKGGGTSVGFVSMSSAPRGHLRSSDVATKLQKDRKFYIDPEKLALLFLGFE